MTIKKAYVELVELLEANKGKKVSTVLEQVRELCESKTQQSTVIKDADGNTIAIFCYYHKQWELVSDVEYSKKANTASGYNSMCKVGTSKWTKAQRVAKQANADILVELKSEKIKPADIEGIQADIESTRTTMDVTEKPGGFATELELTEWLKG